MLFKLSGLKILFLCFNNVDTVRSLLGPLLEVPVYLYLFIIIITFLYYRMMMMIILRTIDDDDRPKPRT